MNMLTDENIKLMGKDDPLMPPPARDTAQPRPRAKRASCTNCRQSKIKCNAGDVFPAPCSNCRKQHRECRTDATFKRTPVRGRLEEVTKELDRIKRARSFQEEESASPASPLTDSQRHHSLDQNAGPLPQLDTGNPFGLDEIDSSSSQVSSQSLEGYHLSGVQIVELFRNFVKFYMPHMPILDTRPSVNSLHQNSPLLFWTIILISAHHPDSLVEPYRTLYARHLLLTVRSIQTIHALLLFCLWPIPVRKQLLDSSWNYCGFALSAAIRMGLHQSDATWEYDFSQFSATDMEIRRRTWIGCYIVSTFLSSDLGLPNLIRPAMDLNEFSRPGPHYNSPDPLTIQFEIERNVARFSATMSQRGGSLAKSSLILMFDRELKILGEQVLATASPHLEINFLGARLSLYAFSILGETTASTIDHHVDLQVKSIWYLGFETAVRLTHLYSTLTNNKTQQAPHRSFPKHMFWILLSSGFYLLKFLAVSPQVPAAESELARNGIRLVYSTLQSWSQHTLDEPARIARIVSLLANAELQGTLTEFTRVNKRPPLSIVADVMEMVGWLRGRQKEKEGTVESNAQVTIENPIDTGSIAPFDPNLMLDPMMLDDSIWEGLDAWLTQEVEQGNLLHPYPEGGFDFPVAG